VAHRSVTHLIKEGTTYFCGFVAKTEHGRVGSAAWPVCVKCSQKKAAHKRRELPVTPARFKKADAFTKEMVIAGFEEYKLTGRSGMAFAGHMGVSNATVRVWKNAYPEFKASYVAYSEKRKKNIVNSVYDRLLK